MGYPTLLLTAALLTVVAGCSESITGTQGGAKSAAELEALKARVTALEQQVQELTAELTPLSLAALAGPQEAAMFDPQEDRKYQTVKAPAGAVLLMLDRVEPYLDGFTVHLRFGNPSTANYLGIKGKVSWGRKLDLTKDKEFNKLTSKDLDLTDMLPAGAWTRVKVNVGPAKVDEIRRIVVEPVFNNLQLRAAGG